MAEHRYIDTLHNFKSLHAKILSEDYISFKENIEKKRITIQDFIRAIVVEINAGTNEDVFNKIIKNYKGIAKMQKQPLCGKILVAQEIYDIIEEEEEIE